MQHMLFYSLGFIALTAAVLVVSMGRAVYSALALIVCFAATSGLFFQLGAQFLAMIQMIVYAGAIMVLFLFVIMLLDPESERFSENRLIRPTFLAVPCAGFFTVLLVRALSSPHAASGDASTVAAPDVTSIAYVLFQDYFLAFEATSILILAAVMGAVILTRRGS